MAKEMARLITLICSALLVGIGNPALADLYKWTDRRGITHFTDEPPPAGVEAERYATPTSSSGTSQANRARHCRNFRKALNQLEAVEGVGVQKPEWLAARQRARTGIDQWCG